MKNAPRIPAFRQDRNRPLGKSRGAMSAQKPSPGNPLFRILKVSNWEDFVKRVVKLLFTLVLLIPLFLLPIYFFFYTLLHV